MQHCGPPTKEDGYEVLMGEKDELRTLPDPKKTDGGEAGDPAAEARDDTPVSSPTLNGCSSSHGVSA